jgi:hypothetical protein
VGGDVLHLADIKPKGTYSPSLSIHIKSPNHGTVYGIPHLLPPATIPPSTSPTGSTKTIPSIPLVINWLHCYASSRELFYSVAPETWIDVSPPSEDATKTRLISESGLFDLFTPAPHPRKNFQAMTSMTPLLGVSPVPMKICWRRGHKGRAEEVQRGR